MAMTGKIISINISPEKGAKKSPVREAILVRGKGLKGDAHYGSVREVSFLDAISIKKFVRQTGGKVRPAPGDFAENITTSGIRWSESRPGDEVRIWNPSAPSDKIILSVTQIGKECHKGCAIRKVTGRCIMPEEGIFAKVVKGGRIFPGYSVEVIPRATIRVCILTCSDKASRGERIDTSGPAIEKELAALKKERLAVKTLDYKIVPDDREKIASVLKEWCDKVKPDIVFTTGGTGFGPRDWTPEATREVMERLCPGLPEYIRWETFKKTKFAAISRATAGIRGQTLIINLPGSEKAVREIVKILLPIIPHSVEILRGKTEHNDKK